MELTLARPTANRAVLPRAQMAELVDAPASGAGDRKVVEVRVLFWAPFVLPAASGDSREVANLRQLLVTLAGMSHADM